MNSNELEDRGYFWEAAFVTLAVVAGGVLRPLFRIQSTAAFWLSLFLFAVIASSVVTMSMKGRLWNTFEEVAAEAQDFKQQLQDQ
jgi:hypothetical protein